MVTHWSLAKHAYCCCNSDDKGAEHSQLIRKRYFFPLRQERLFLSIVGFLGITVSIGYLFFLLLFNSGENKAFMIEIALIPYFAGPCVSTRASSPPYSLQLSPTLSPSPP